MTIIIRYLILFLSLSGLLDNAFATVPVVRYPSGTPVQVCTPSDSNTSCGSGGSSGSINSGTVNIVPVYVGISTLGPSSSVYIVSGNVGIGTAKPLAALDVVGAVPSNLGQVNIYSSSNAQAALAFAPQNNSTQGFLMGLDLGNAGSSKDFFIYDKTNSATRFHITPGGNVGLGGETTADATLEIAKSGSNPLFMVSSAVGNDGDYLIVNSGGKVGIGWNTPTGNLLEVGGGSTISTTTSFLDSVAPTGGLLVEGNVGIGTITASSKLKVNGTVTATSFSGAGTGLTGTAASLTAGTVTTNANLTGPITSSGNATSIASQTGTGTTFVVDTSPTLVTPNIGTPSTCVLTNCTGTASGLTAGTVTTNANLTGGVTSVGNTATVVTNANLTGDVTSVGNATTLSSTYAGWTDGGTNVYTTAVADNVAIGTTTPHASLEITKTAAGTAPFMISSAGSTPGDYMVVSSTANVGIGTINPTNQLVLWNSNATLYTGNLGTANANSLYLVNANTTGSNFSALNFRNYVSATSHVTGSAIVSINSSHSGGSEGSNLAFLTRVGGVTGERMRIQGGNIGIGTSTANSLLSVAGGVQIGSNTTNMATAAPADGLFVQGNVGLGTATPGGGLVVFTGNVGIGTVSPTSALQIVGATSTSGNLSSSGGNVSSAAGSCHIITGRSTFCSSANGLIELANNASTDFSRLNFGGTTSSFPALVHQGTSLSHALADGTMGGNVGIGTISPTASLEIVKNSSTVPLMVSSTATGAGDYLRVDSAGNVGIGTTSYTAALSIMNGNVGIGTISPKGILEVSGNLTNNFSSLLVGSNGNVGIGTNSASNSLYVHGTIGVGSGVSVLRSTFTNTQWTFPSGSTLIGWNGSNTSINGTAGGSGNLNIMANGYTRLYFDAASGNIGIGTTGAPRNYLDISPTGNPTSPTTMTSTGNVGIGTLLPQGKLHIKSAGGALLFQQATAPTVANNDCGTTSQGTIVAGSTDVSGTTTVGSLTVTSCAVTFNTAFNAAPNCICMDDSNVLAVRCVATASKLTITSLTSMSGDNVTWFCPGNF